ncbi:MAG: hypothetical protein V2B14_01615 [bacterium]
MGIAPSQSRMHTILRNKIDIEFDIEKKSVQKQNLIRQALTSGNSNGIKEQEKKLDNDMKNLETMQKALETEYDSVKALISKNCEKGFKYYGN